MNGLHGCNSNLKDQQGKSRRSKTTSTVWNGESRRSCGCLGRTCSELSLPLSTPACLAHAAAGSSCKPASSLRFLIIGSIRFGQLSSHMFTRSWESAKECVKKRAHHETRKSVKTPHRHKAHESTVFALIVPALCCNRFEVVVVPLIPSKTNT